MTKIINKSTNSLRKRILMTFIAVVVICSSAFIVIYTVNNRSEWLRLYDNRGRLLSSILASLSYEGVSGGTDEVIKKAAYGVQKNPNVLGVRFYNSQNRLIYECSKRPLNHDMFEGGLDFRAIIDRYMTKDISPIIQREDYSIFYALVLNDNDKQNDRKSVQDFSGSSSELKAAGYVAVAIDRMAFSQNFKRVFAEDISVSLLFIFLGSSIIFFSIKRFTRPLEELESAVTKFGKDRLLSRLPVSDIDEIGRIINAFNIMAESIISQEAERQKLESMLRHAHKMEAVGTMASGIAHDFRNILTAIIGFANIVKLDLGRGHPSRQDIDHILSISKRATRLIHGLLAYSRRQMINPIPFNINRLILDMENVIRTLILKEHKIQLRLSDERLVIIADEGQIEQLLLNLCLNARDAMPDGGVITISTSKKLISSDFINYFGLVKSGWFVEMVISDTGIGMGASILKRMYEPFFTTKKSGNDTGTGLGLSIVYGIVKQNGGFIDVISKPGRGTKFKVYLPLAGESSEFNDKDNVEPLLKGFETVLIAVDDDEMMLYVKDILELFGYKVIEAKDSDDVVRLLAQNPDVRLLILGSIIYGRNGIDVLKTARQANPAIKAIFISGYSEDIRAEDAFEEDGIASIIKPVVPEDFLEKVRSLLNQ